jgi:ankyrin repeat protein
LCVPSGPQQFRAEVVRALLAAKPDVNAKREDGVTALYMASQGSHLEVVEALLAAGATVNDITAKGLMALAVAVAQKRLDVTAALLEWNADIYATANTALMLHSLLGETIDIG